MNEKDFTILCQGIAFGLALTIAFEGSTTWAIGILVLLLCSLILTIWRLR